MAKRLVTCPVVGTGADGDPYRAAVSVTTVPGLRYVAVMHSDPATGVPTHTRTVAVVSAPDLSAVLALSGVRVIPAGALDDPLSSFTAGQRTTLGDIATEAGVDTSAYTGATLLRRVLRDIGRAYEPAFDEDSFDAREAGA